MTTATQTNEGTTGAWPSAMSGSFGTFTWTSNPAHSATDAQISTTTFFDGAKSMRVNDSCTYAASYIITSSPTSVYLGIYLYLTAAPANDFCFAILKGDGYAESNQIGITTDRRLYMRLNQVGVETISTAGTVYQSSANAVPLNQWFRVDGCLSTSTTNQAKLFVDTQSTTATYDTGQQSGTGIGTVNMYEFGPQSSASGAGRTFLSSGQYLYVDTYNLDTAGFPGPQVGTVTAACALTASSTLTATAVKTAAGASTLTATSTLTSAGVVTKTGAATLTATSTLTSDATVIGSGAGAALTATGILTVAAQVTAAATVTLAATSTLTAGGTVPTYYPGGTRVHARTTIYDNPSDSTLGGPAVLAGHSTETEAISDDLNAAMLEGAGFTTIQSAVAAIWSAITGAKARANHTGTQLAATISDFNTAVRTSRLDQMATPTADVAMGSRKITGLATPTASTDAVTKAYADTAAVDSETVRLALAARPRTYWPATMTTAPTVTVSANNAATSVSNSARVAANDSAFTYINCNVTSAGSITGSETYSSGNVKQTNTTVNYDLVRTVFETDAADFEFIVQCQSVDISFFRILVDGEFASATKTQVSTVVGEVRRIRVQFGSAVARQIIFEGQCVRFIGVQKAVNRSIWAADYVAGPVAAVTTDSWGTGGSSSDPVFTSVVVQPYIWDSFAMRLHYALGWNVHVIAGPAAGYNENLYGSTALKDKLSDVNDIDPVFVVHTMGLNDRGGTMATVQSTINTVMANCLANNPRAKVFVCGPGKPKDGVSAYSTLPTISGYLSTAATANGFTFVSTTDWITGTGCLGSENNVGNSDTACSADQIHLTPAGYAYWGHRLLGAIRSSAA